MLESSRKYPLGSHLIVYHFGYSHHGIYAGKGRVIHYSGFAHFFRKQPIEVTSIENFARGKKIIIRHYESSKYKNRAVVRRMRSRMHENNYHLIINNCEHLCSWAITGVESSPQVIRMMGRLTTLGYISSIMSYMNGVFLTLATACFALVLYIKMKLKTQAKMELPTYVSLRDRQQKK
ncbi:lecithin retinol acyltransferase family protein [Acinetobacter silvestris]|uniref:Phosphatidylcholine--retinol O-acyltransferase n=1 Tax=Acinetobacter silvestris TaxID=1977882 RepID=A0A1Y3CHU8_9GAMM|nr:lecithin retinol acyltransferase family protein [Acinetobacter silvestris]OTG65174.1 phosphatidylcholine--retinol O-acyltransferase [Acinetobacter silvestris]